MVASTPTSTNNAPTNDNEKRRKQTVERARANHLSRQLQMRLQYAKLKVQYGWQKQNLNEVENLYFHHSHQKPKPNASPSTMTATSNELSTSCTDATTPTSNSSQSSLSFKLGPSSLSRSHTGDSHSPPDAEDVSSNPLNTQATSAHNPSQPTHVEPVSSANPSEIRNLIHMEVNENKPSQEPKSNISPSPDSPSPAEGPSGIPKCGLSSFSPSGSSYRSNELPQPPTPIATAWPASRASLETSSPNHYPNVPLQRQPTLPASPSSRENSYTYPAVSLTYDSFWSSHSSSASSRSFRSSMGSIAPSKTASGISTSGLSMSDAYASRLNQVKTAGAPVEQQVGAGAAAGRE